MEVHQVIDVISDEDLRELMAVESPHCVSFYLPTHPAGPGVAEDPIRLKNLIARAKQELETLGVRSSDAADLLRSAESVVDDAQFWAHATAGLALFVTSDGERRRLLAGPVEEGVAVADRLWIAPLIPFVTGGGSFHVLALSENQIRLLRGTRHAVAELGLGAIPASLGDALRFDDRESQLHSHGADRVGSGRVSATFHGHGGTGDYDDVDQARFLHAVDRGLAGIVGDRDPLVLAGVDEIVSRFRALTHHTNVVEAFVAGNPERLSPKELHGRALPLVARDLDADRYRVLQALGSPSTPTVETVPGTLDAAAGGRVANLLIRRGQRVWGSYDADDRSVDEHVERQPGDRDLIDLAVRDTIGHGGAVFAADASEMPSDAPMVAILRY